MPPCSSEMLSLFFDFCYSRLPLLELFARGHPKHLHLSGEGGWGGGEHAHTPANKGNGGTASGVQLPPAAWTASGCSESCLWGWEVSSVHVSHCWKGWLRGCERKENSPVSFTSDIWLLVVDINLKCATLAMNQDSSLPFPSKGWRKIMEQLGPSNSEINSLAEDIKEIESYVFMCHSCIFKPKCFLLAEGTRWH